MSERSPAANNQGWNMGMIRGFIRISDRASCGGTVAEGSSCEFSDGIGYSFQGARMSCSQNCVIAEGDPSSILSNGKAQVLDGQRTSGGCGLISTLTGVDGVVEC
jgi:uncharacterized Zn-binding protein involved in type VI secretion